MKIAYILADPGIGLFGSKGASVHAQEMIRAFRQLGHEVTVYCTKRGNRADDPTSEAVPPDLGDLPVFVVPVTGVKGAAAREQAVARTAARMAAIAGEETYDLIYERYSLFSAAGAALAESTSAPLVLEVNAPLLSEQAAHRSLHDADGAHQATLRSFSAAHLISCVSEPVANWARGILPQGSAKAPSVRVTPNGVNTARFTPGAAGRTGQYITEQFTVGFLGTLKPWHGTELLLEAFAAAPAADRNSWRCEILGDGPHRQQLQQLADQLGISHQVSFRGAAAPETVPAALADWDVAVAPYPAPGEQQNHYFSPMKVYEYLAAGLPTVASAVGELPRLIDDGVTGVLVPGSDVAALAAALAQLAADHRLRDELGRAARAEVLAHHDWRHRASAVIDAVHLRPPLLPTPHLPTPLPVEEAMA